MLKWLRRLFEPSPAELAQQQAEELRRAFWRDGLWKMPPLEVWDRMPPEVKMDLIQAGIVSAEDVWNRDRP